MKVAHAHSPRTHTIGRLGGTEIIFPQCSGRACQCQAVNILMEISPSLCSPPYKDEDLLNKHFLKLQRLWPARILGVKLAWGFSVKVFAVQHRLETLSCHQKNRISPSFYLLGIHSKTPRGCLKSRITVPNLRHNCFFLYIPLGQFNS